MKFKLYGAGHWWLLLMAAALLVSLTACGYQLRGSRALPAEMAITYVKAKDAYGLIASGLRRQLKASGVQLALQQSDATATLEIMQNQFDRRVLSVGSTGKAREFEFHHLITFRVIAAGGGEIMPRRRVSITRNFLFDETDVLGKTNEASLVKQEMREDLVRQILVILAAGASG